MEPTSPKGDDLRRDGRYALHCSVEDSSGGGGEFYVRGRASLTRNPVLREQAARVSSYVPEERYILFILSIDFAFVNRYVDGTATPQRWQAG
jgi:hypothetical protein